MNHQKLIGAMKRPNVIPGGFAPSRRGIAYASPHRPIIEAANRTLERMQRNKAPLVRH